jgi:hypothetical protein
MEKKHVSLFLRFALTCGGLLMLQVMGTLTSFDLLCKFQRMEPPSNPFVHVLVEEDVGEIVTLDGSVRLSKGTKHYIRKSDVEILIRQQKLSVLPE